MKQVNDEFSLDIIKQAISDMFYGRDPERLNTRIILVGEESKVWKLVRTLIDPLNEDKERL